MKKLILIGLLPLIVLVCNCVKAEDINLLSYYPSPTGVYNVLKSKTFLRYDATVLANDEATKLTHINLGSNSTTGAEGQNYLYCTISGGMNNTASNRSVVIGGGESNFASGQYSTIGGGTNNQALGAHTTTIAGGWGNTTNGQHSTIGGGNNNSIAAGSNWSTISGGLNNQVSGLTASSCTIAGGTGNRATFNYATVCGGSSNIASGDHSFIGGGESNAASGDSSMVIGGINNAASGHYSLAAGRRAKAINSGSFVWADSTDADFNSAGNNTFNVRASGGIFLRNVRQYESPEACAQLYITDRGEIIRGNFSGGGDLAEYMNILKNEKIEQGVLVSIDSNKVLSLSSKSYDANLVGVVTGPKTNVTYLNGKSAETETTVSCPVALAGVVYIKVNDENGFIKSGDPITSSSTSGIGMKAAKAGKIVGYAMEEFNGKEGEILVFANLTYYVPPEEYLSLRGDIETLKKEMATLKK
jgi:hypothetical protein